VRCCGDGAGQQSRLAAMPLHIYRLIVTWQTNGCQSRRHAALKLLLRRDLSCSLKHSGCEAAIPQALNIDNTKERGVTCNRRRVRRSKALTYSYPHDELVGTLNEICCSSTVSSVTKFVLRLRHLTFTRCRSHGSVLACVSLDRASWTSMLSKRFE
jgi:hypothetical protein